MKRTLLVIAALALSPSLFAQSPLTETIEVRVTNVDVVVVDRAGNPVPGLTREDFEVTEGGKPQPITNFYEINESTAPAAGAAPVTPAAADAVPEEVGRRRLVVFVDNYSINPLSRNQAFVALENSLGTLMRPGDEAMIVFWDRNQEVIAPFTSDRAELIRKFKEAAGHTGGGMTANSARSRVIEHASQMLADAKAPSTRKISFQQAYDESAGGARAYAEELYASETRLLGGVKRMLTSLAGVEGKKVFIFLGAELAENPGLDLIQQVDAMFQEYIRGMRPAVLREQNRSLTAELQALARHANATGVTMYLVDTADRSRGADPTARLVDNESEVTAQMNTSMAMGTIASMTGGLAVPGGKSFEKALDAVARDLSSYYSLGYRSPGDAEGDRRIVVKVKRPGLHVRSRTTYVARKGDDELKDRVIANVFHSGVKSDFPVSLVASAPEKLENGQYKVKLKVTLPSTMTFIPQDDSLVGEFAVFFATGKEDGALSEVSKAVQPMKFPGNARDAIAAQKSFTYDAALVVRPGEQIVSVAVTDTLAGTSGFARTKINAQ